MKWSVDQNKPGSNVEEPRVGDQKCKLDKLVAAGSPLETAAAKTRKNKPKQNKHLPGKKEGQDIKHKTAHPHQRVALFW